MSHIKLGLNEQITFDTPIAGQVNSKEIPLETYVDSVSNLGFFDSGLLPRTDTGLISYRRAAGWESFVFQVEAGEHMVIWGRSERDPNAKKLSVAMPYRIVLGDHKFAGGKWHLIGARHFYSPKPIKSWSDILYHCNVPNLNCRGYNSTGVGWICLYHTGNYTGMDLMQRCIETSMRTSGGEAYNDANMSRTDGARFYQSAKKPDYFYDPTKWAAKTKKEGWKWVLDEAKDLLLPVKLENPAKTMMAKHVTGGKPASLFDLTRGLYSAYYNDTMHLKPANLMDPKNPFTSHYPFKQKQLTYSYIVEFANSLITTIPSLKAPGWAPKIEKIKCAGSGKMFPETDSWSPFLDSDGYVKLIHSTVLGPGHSSGEYVSAYVDTSKIKLSKEVSDRKDDLYGSMELPAKSTAVMTMYCRKTDCVLVKNRSSNRWFHANLEGRHCDYCERTFTPVEPYAPKVKGERCKRCIGLVKCPTCDKNIKETDIRTIELLVSDKIGIERLKEALVDLKEKGKDLSELESITISKPQTQKRICCTWCINSLTQCLCGNVVPTSKVVGVYTDSNTYVTNCRSCAKPDPTSNDAVALAVEDLIQHTTSAFTVKDPSVTVSTTKFSF